MRPSRRGCPRSWRPGRGRGRPARRRRDLSLGNLLWSFSPGILQGSPAMFPAKQLAAGLSCWSGCIRGRAYHPVPESARRVSCKDRGRWRLSFARVPLLAPPIQTRLRARLRATLLGLVVDGAAEFLGEVVVVHALWQVVVGVAVSGPVALAPHKVRARVAQRERDLGGRPAPHVLERPADAGVCRVRLRRRGEVGRRLGERDAPLGHADEPYGLGGGDREREAVRVGVADVFGGEDDEATGHEDGVLPRLEHPGEVVERGVGVAAAHALYKGAYDVVVLLTAVAERPLPHRPLDIGGLHAPRARRRDFQGVEHPPPVAPGGAQEGLAPVSRYIDAELFETALDQGRKVLLSERAQPQHARAGEQ